MVTLVAIPPPVTQETNTPNTAPTTPTQLANTAETLPTETNTLDATKDSGTAVLDIPEIGSITLSYQKEGNEVGDTITVEVLETTVPLISANVYEYVGDGVESRGQLDLATNSIEITFTRAGERHFKVSAEFEGFDGQKVIKDFYINVSNAPVVTGGNTPANPPVVSNVTPTPTPAANTPATFAGEYTGTVKEDDLLTYNGTLDVTDPDAGEEKMQAGIYSGNFGSLSMDTLGNWTYNLNNNNSAVQALNDGETLSDAITVRSLDGTAQIITITIDGKTDVIPDNPTDFSQLTTFDGPPGTKGLKGTITDPDGIASVKIEYSDGSISNYTDGTLSSEGTHAVGTTYTITVTDDNNVVKTETGTL